MQTVISVSRSLAISFTMAVLCSFSCTSGGPEFSDKGNIGDLGMRKDISSFNDLVDLSTLQDVPKDLPRNLDFPPDWPVCGNDLEDSQSCSLTSMCVVDWDNKSASCCNGSSPPGCCPGSCAMVPVPACFNGKCPCLKFSDSCIPPGWK